MIDTLLHNKERGLSKEKKRTVKKQYKMLCMYLSTVPAVHALT